MPETKELVVQLDRRGEDNLVLLARLQGVTPEELAAKIIDKALKRMTSTFPSRSNVKAFSRAD